MPKNKSEQVNFDPSKHIVSLEESKNIFQPEHFVSLRAIVDKEKAQLAAEAINQQLQPLFDELAIAEVMLAEAKDELDKEYLKNEISDIKNKMNKIINGETPRIGKNLYNLANIIASSNYYKEIALGFHNDKSLPGTDFSQEEMEVLKHYDETAKDKLSDLLKEANIHQQRVLEYLIKNNFSLPDTDKLDDYNKEILGEHLCFTVERYPSSYKYSGLDTAYNRCKKDFEEGVASLKEEQRQIFLAYFNTPEIKHFINLMSVFDIEIGQKSYTGEVGGGKDVWSEKKLSSTSTFRLPKMNIRYDEETVKKVLKEDWQNFLVPNSPKRIHIYGLPCALKPGFNLEEILNSVREYGDLLVNKPDEIIKMLSVATPKEKVGEKGFNKLSLYSIFEGKEKEISPSYAFLG